LTLQGRAAACAQSTCLGKGVAVRSDFSVQVTIDGNSMPNATVKISTQKEENVFSATTDALGSVRLKLPPGAYRLTTELMGARTEDYCFHVNKRGARSLTYEWAGAYVVKTPHIAGKFIDVRLVRNGEFSDSGQPLEVPLGGVKFKLQDPLTAQVWSAASDENGNFAFDSVPEGIYVLHVEGGIAPGGRQYHPVDLQIRLEHKSARGPLIFRNGYDCGTVLEH
jgi:hypothetical protein